MEEEFIEKLNRIEEKYKVGKLQLHDLISMAYSIGIVAEQARLVKESDSLPCVSDRRELLEKYSEYLDTTREWMDKESFKENISDFLQ